MPDATHEPTAYRRTIDCCCLSDDAAEEDADAAKTAVSSEASCAPVAVPAAAASELLCVMEPACDRNASKVSANQPACKQPGREQRP